MQPFRSSSSLFTTLLSAVVLIIGWYLLVWLVELQAFLLPLPHDVLFEMWVMISDGRLPRHTLYTLGEVVIGLAVGVMVALPLAYLLAKSPLAERLISPYLIASQAVPVVAIAPLLTIWIRSVFWSRVMVAVLVVFFPILINAIAGLRSVPSEFYALLGTLRASRWQTFRKLEFPAALPVIISGLKIGATLSVIGALVGEFVRPRSEGLGFLLLTARAQFKTDGVFAILIVLAAMSLMMYGLIAILERRWLKWQTISN
ncbi:MAG: ABC transporter permease [Ardenticatenaceae bacterium]|nr:ABC transporter permease [Ardenticatenaceae bacterium]